MRIDVITLFPEVLEAFLGSSILARARAKGILTVHLHNLRSFAHDKHATVDDRPYGGGPGMVLRPEPLFEAIETVKGLDVPGRVILMSASGRLFTQSIARSLSSHDRLIFVCGHYEGVDQRVVDHAVDEELSIGDYILTNGALAAVVVIDAVARLLPGVLGNEFSPQDESFEHGLLEAPQYTRPQEFRGWRVPDVLLSGNHAQIAQWRRKMAEEKTRRVRPDLWAKCLGKGGSNERTD
ncbi:tRNA (guanosine(37)-N1)-methyltransferase TrmD [Candidatus Methylacidithermus pantelleriae]|uniref:tRNA (guanine-N(1)-)-methyltransferase n=1 Tax=Candidatus Methylacidithermus pantelleriae TaxID=2744239 RepID=A0A8J2BN68_9BACT|nr:tRNA (guanosine(37)-N1)-methyltransferase TrmD [Candidatus Methylacidithermus pantelleriae]CAF0704438.1 tRNA m(1)G37 methyltransferase [Candidatus Methylacidithermus pantelleriae]